MVARLREALRAGPPVRLAVLFGSSVYGAVRPDSDVDIAILIGQPGRDDSVELALGRDLALAARTEVDLIRIDKAPTLLKWQIAVKGVLLVQETPVEFARFRARAASEYIDYAPALAYHGEDFRRRLIEQGTAQ